MAINYKESLKEHGPLLSAQTACLLICLMMFGAGPGIAVGFIAGGVFYGFRKEGQDPGSLRSYYGNWKRALSASALMAAIVVCIGVPVMMIAILSSPTAAEDWNQTLIDYGLTGEALLFRLVLIGALALGFIGFAHLIFTRLAFKMVAVMKRR